MTCTSLMMRLINAKNVKVQHLKAVSKHRFESGVYVTCGVLRLLCRPALVGTSAEHGKMIERVALVAFHSAVDVHAVVNCPQKHGTKLLNCPNVSDQI